MKMMNLMMMPLFLIAANQAFSSEKSIAAEQDTLKKTSQYMLFSKTEKIENAEFSKNKSSKSQEVFIRIDYAKTAGLTGEIKTGTQSSRQFGDGMNPTISNVRMLTGKYSDMTADAVSKTTTVYTLKDVQFPLRLQVFLMGEIIDFELLEPGKWNLDLILKK